VTSVVYGMLLCVYQAPLGSSERSNHSRLALY